MNFKVNLIWVLLYLLAFILIASLMIGCSADKKDEITIAESSEVNDSENNAIENKNLYPAFIYDNGKKLWGYINSFGDFVITPKYEVAEYFQPVGLARIWFEDKVGIINKQGEILVTPIYDNIGDFEDGLAIGQNWKDNTTTSSVIDTKGNIVFEKEYYISRYSEGLAAIITNSTENSMQLYGYIDRQGNLVIEPIYSFANDFVDGKALVSTSDGKQFYIDKNANLVGEYIDETDSYYLNYLNKNYNDGLKIVSKELDYNTLYGLYDKDGKVILGEEYSIIERLSEDLFYAAKYDEHLIPIKENLKALFDKTGKQLTDYIFYDINSASEGYFYVTDYEYTYLVDSNGNEYTNLPRTRGNGSINIIDGLISVNVGNLSYYTLDGELIWKSSNNFKLSNGLTINKITINPNRFLSVYYPEIEGLNDETIEDSINSKLVEKFKWDDQYSIYNEDIGAEGYYVSADFTAEANKDLLIISKSGYIYPVDAAHGQPSLEDIHISLKTGRVFALKDLFTSGAKYKETLENIIEKQIATKSLDTDMYFTTNPELNEANFRIKRDHLELFYSPYEIAAYAYGFPTFEVPYDEIMDIIDTDGELWNSFDKNN